MGRKSFSFQLMKNFLISTLIPFLIITSVIAHIYSREYKQDVQSLLNSTIDSMVSNITTYLMELEQVTLQPYYNEELFDFLRGLSKDNSYDILEKIKLQHNLNSNMSFVRYSREDVNGIFIVNDEKCLYYTVTDTDRRTVVRGYEYKDQEWYQNAVEADGRCLLMGPHLPDYIAPYDRVISLVRSIVEIQTREPLYVMKIDINTSIFERIFKDFSFHVDSKIILREENQQLIYANKSLSAKDQEILCGQLTENGTVSLSDGRFQIYTYPIRDYPWSIMILLSERELQAKTGIIYFTAILLYGLGITMAVLSYNMASKRLVKSIDDMSRIFSAIKDEDFSQKYEYESGTELDKLGASLNQMTEELEQRIQREYIMTIRQKDIEFRALQSQIQPHFLFNTLNNFIALNQIGDRDALENALYELSGMLRYILKAPALITLADEMAFIENYCALQKLRFSERLSYHMEVEPGFDRVMIPKLLIQPIVENSILHGVEPCNKTCTIKISVKEAPGGIFITVEDDGIGCDVEQLEKVHGIGLANVEGRLKNFSEKSTFHMVSRPGNGTKTWIYLYLEEV